MKEISEKDLLSYFTSRSNRFLNSEGMLFGMGQVNDIWTEFNLCNHDRGPLAIDIVTEYDEPLGLIIREIIRACRLA
jgi:hypothetical protein